MVKQFDQYIGPYQVLQLQVQPYMEVMALKEYSLFPKAPGVESHHQTV